MVQRPKTLNFKNNLSGKNIIRNVVKSLSKDMAQRPKTSNFKNNLSGKNIIRNVVKSLSKYMAQRPKTSNFKNNLSDKISSETSLILYQGTRHNVQKKLNFQPFRMWDVQLCLIINKVIILCIIIKGFSEGLVF